MADIDELRKWCNEAKVILDRTGKDSRGTMEDRNADVAKLLKLLQGVAGLESQHAELLGEYGSITARAVEGAKSDDKAAVKAASRELSLLKNRLRIALTQDPGASKKTLKDGEKAVKRLASSEKQDWAQDAYANRYDEILPDLQVAWTTKSAAGVSKTVRETLEKAYGVSDGLATAKKWAEAKAKLDDVEKAVQAVMLLYKAGKDYFDAYAAIDPEFKAALTVYRLKAAKLAVLSAAFDKTYGETSSAAGKAEWDKALASVAPLKAAAIALRDAGAEALAEKPAFDLAYNAILNLPAAQRIAKAPPASLVHAEARVFREKFEAVSAARNAGNYSVATAAIPALTLAIKNLIEADAKVQERKRLFEEALGRVAGYADAKALAAANSPAVTDKIAAFTLADGKVDAQVKLQAWDLATPLVGALATATTELLKAKTLFNTGYDVEKQRAFAQKMKDLKPKTDPATTPGPTAHITALKQAVKDRVDQIDKAVGTADFANAERLHALLLAELPKLATAVSEHAQHLILFNAAKNGAVKDARDLALVPDKLATERTKALAATEARIVHFADKGSITGKADPMVADWVAEAGAWTSAKAASDNLNDGAEPDEGLMRALASQPGGGKVLDALMDGLPEGKPEKFLHAALKVRFGVDVKQFEKKNPDRVSDLSGLTPISPDAPDKSLKKLYQVFCKVPLKNVKGKVDELIHFDEDAHGAAAGGKKIYMYCGRANDPNGSKQQFGKSVLPEGEEIDDDFQVATGEGIPDELPYFDFAAMHEVGHAVDDAEEIMAKKPPGQLAGWQRHTSDAVAAVAAAHFKYNVDYVKQTLASASSTPPTTVFAPEGGATQKAWDQARDEVLNWCRSVRVGMSLWNNPALSKHVAINGRVYQEAYDGDWVSYKLEARSKGITGYQFRSPAEWFAELYAAYFSGKLKKTHPYAEWLKPLKKLA